MITLITAVPGSGKTLYAVGRILKLLGEGRLVYANIAGLQIEGVRPAPDDWRDTPEGSVVIYDECQQEHLYPSTGQRGEVRDERIRAMETHRHTGHDLIFITQAPTFVHHHIRKLVGEHIHLYRPNGMKGANVYTWGFTCENPNDRREQERADHYVMKYNPDHFKLYKSATVHTHKFRIPRKIAVVLVLILCGAGWVAWSLSDGFASMSSAADLSETSVESAEGQGEGQAGRLPAPPPAASLYSWSDTPSATPIAGCVSFPSRALCQCFDSSGVTIAMEHAACLSVIAKPIPRSIHVGGSYSSSSSSSSSGSSSTDSPSLL